MKKLVISIVSITTVMASILFIYWYSGGNFNRGDSLAFTILSIIIGLIAWIKSL